MVDHKLGIENTPKILKLSAVIVFGLAVLFYWSFLFAKHDRALRGIIPFGEDPYDAVGSFGSVMGILVALVSLVRAFRPYGEHAPSRAQCVYLVRSQEAVVLAVLITVAADTVAMVRHCRMWIGAASRHELIVMLGGLTLVALAVHLLIRASQGKLPSTRSRPWKRASIAVALAILLLAVYPEQLIARTSTHLLTVIVGAFVLFAPMRSLLTVLIPYKADETRTDATPPSRLSGPRLRWGLVLLVGALIGAFAFLGEMTEGGGGFAVLRLLFVASVFIGLGIAGFVIAYAFLGRPLGLGPRG